jgi:hypothetical protein
MCVCIGADDLMIRPFIILEWVTAEDKIWLMNSTENKVQVSFRKAAIMTTKLFEEWSETVFIPICNDVGKSPTMKAERVYCLMA